jgi:alpha-galactosidase/6-phospho-beta-glucosidase family protein
MEGRGGPRIAFVGGGSDQWGPKIIQDVASNEELRGGTLVLHDINDETLGDMSARFGPFRPSLVSISGSAT